ncbi:hypothetical protein [Methylotuvimicrobium sp. KM1]|uniref:hypothetical protein n=1 Tax=Methylotuvimicrobium sp. KM1 TaxID=3377707 RepID=UPI00384EA5FF
MKKTNSNRMIVAWLSILFFSFFMSQISFAADHEDQCFNEVQGKIPWNDEKNMNWRDDNVKQLCKGTTKPLEPGKCFSKVRSERVNWGKSSQWEWKNIINLCAGTNDAEKTVECFNKGIASGADWRDAILTCQRNLSSQGKNNKLDWNR